MLYLRRAASLAGTDVRRDYAALRRPGLRIYGVCLRGAPFDTRAIGPIARRNSPLARGLQGHVTVVLDGALVLRRGDERELGRRSIVTETGAPWDERWEGPRFACLVCEWDDAHGPLVAARGEARLSEVDFGRAARIFEALMAGEARGAAGTALAVEAGALARSFGADLPRWSDEGLAEAPPDGQALADVLSHAFTRLDEKPMWVDLEGGAAVSERHLRRRIRALGEWLDMPGGGFRDRLRMLRAHAAATLLGAPRATVEDVARAVGYGSARALVLALRAEGLGGHDEIRAAVREGRVRR